MSSTTERRERGQILVLFTLSAFAILVAAALAFDVGMMLVERRDQQNAADAAALAGARYLPVSEARARAAAADMATKNGFTDGGAVDVTTYIPPAHGIYKGMPGFIEVQISASRPSVFGGTIGRAVWPVGAYAVAANQPGLTFSFGMLALNETACKAIHVSGNGLIYSTADIQSNSSGSGCGGDPSSGTWYGFSRTGGGEIDIDADDGTCRTVGAIQDQGSGNMDTCQKAPYSFPLPDPLRDLPAVPQPDLAPAITPYLHSTDIPDYCPGATNTARQPSAASPRKCVIGQGSAESSKQWILSPGLYPGGLEIKGDSTIYLLPGIYWIGGGGLSVAGDSDVFSVASADAADLVVRGAGGVLIYNSKLGTSAGGAAGPVTLGGSGALVNIQPLDPTTGTSDEVYRDIVIFQDRTVSATVTLNGSDSMGEVRGIVYVPKGEVKLNGSDTSNDVAAKLVVDEIIADTFLIDGKGGTIRVLRERGVDVVISGAGLVE